MYRAVDTKFWSDVKIRELPPDSKYLFLYLLTNQHTHLSGIYYLPFPVILYETGLDNKKVRKGIDTLSIGNLAYFDHETDNVWVVNMLSYQAWGVKIKTAVENQLKNLHNSLLVQKFIEHYRERLDESGIPYRYPIDGVSRLPVPVPVPVLNINSIKEENNPSKNNIPYTEFQTLWNEASEAWGLPTLKDMTIKRKQKLKTRMASEVFRENWKQALTLIGDFPFLYGENKRQWRANPDWFLRSDEAVVKILEGAYEGKFEQ